MKPALTRRVICKLFQEGVIWQANSKSAYSARNKLRIRLTQIQTQPKYQVIDQAFQTVFQRRGRF